MMTFEKMCETGCIWEIWFWYDRNDENNPYEIRSFGELVEEEATDAFNNTPIGCTPASGYKLAEIQIRKRISEDELILVATKDVSGTWYE